MSGTSHDHDQPAHLKVKADLKHVPSGECTPSAILLMKALSIDSFSSMSVHADVSVTTYAGPEQRFCPAGECEYFTEYVGQHGESTLGDLHSGT